MEHGRSPRSPLPAPRFLEKYLRQDKDILDLISRRMTWVKAQIGQDKDAQVNDELLYLKEHLKLRRKSHEERSVKSLIGDMLAYLLENLIKDVENKVDKAPSTTPISQFPPMIRKIIKRDEVLKGCLQTLQEVEREHYPFLFVPKSIPVRRPTPLTERSLPTISEEPNVESPQPLLAKLQAPPLSLTQVLDDTERMVLDDTESLLKGDGSVQKRLSITEHRMSKLCKDVFEWPEFEKRLQGIRDKELEFFPEQFFPIVAYTAGVPPAPDFPETFEAFRAQRLALRAQQQATTSSSPSHPPESSEDSQGALSGDQTQQQVSSPEQQAPESPERRTYSLSPSTQPSTSPSQSAQTSSVQPSSNEPPTSIKSAELTPALVVTPTPSRVDSNAIKASPVPASRLKYRLEIEKQKSSDGLVQQVRFADNDMLPGA